MAKEAFDEAFDKAFDKETIDAKVREGFPLAHRWHNDFHLEMPFGLVNDPNGISWHAGKYHIFFQWNPLGVEHKHKCWGHVETADFVHYRLPVLALWPSDVHDKDGCYSGAGFVEDGVLRLVYTCNRKEDDVRTPAQRLASWQGEKEVARKDEIIIEHEPPGYTAHFRDPSRFCKDGREFLVLGAQTEAEKGRAVLYEKKADGWKLAGEIETELSDFGYMWECPTLLPLPEGDVLFFSPQGLPAEEYRWQNLYQSGYVAGKLDLASLKFRHGDFHELDRGFDFYAPQVFSHEGRVLLFGWMGMPEREEEYPTAAEGWLFSLTMPRELHLRDGKIFSAPPEEMKALRKGAAQVFEAAGTEAFGQALAPKSEVELEIAFGEAQEVCIDLDYKETGERMRLSYARNTAVMTLDREGMKLGGRGVRRFRLEAADSLKLQIYQDKTAIEVFFQEGAEAASFFVFPTEDVCPELRISADGKLGKIEGKMWELGGFIWNAE